MRPTNTIQLFVILVLTISCASQNLEAQDKSPPPPRAIEINGSDQPKPSPSGEESKEYVSGEILVKFKDGTTEGAIRAIQRDLNMETIRLVSKPNLYLMKILDESSVESVMGRLRNYKEVKYSEPNYVRTTH